MKKILFFLVLLLILGSCQKDEVNDLVPSGLVDELELRDASPYLISSAEKASLLALYDGLAATGSTGQLNWRNTDGTINETTAWVGVHLDASDHVYRLIINEKGLSGDIPPEWGNLAYLKYLFLHNNQINTIPANWGDLPSLQYLSLVYNQIETIPAEWSGLSSLQSLYLNNNRIKTIPADWGDLTNLQYLHLHTNWIETIPAEWSGLSSLRSLYLNNNRIEAIPAAWEGLQSLQYLHLENNQIKTIPANWGDLPNLRYLHLENNEIEAIHAKWSGLPGLNELRIHDNRIEAIPAEWSGLSNLQRLYLYNNQIKTIPANWGDLPNLYYINLSDNLINVLPIHLEGLPTRYVLNLSNNQIACYPSTWLTEVCDQINLFDYGNPASFSVFCSSGGAQYACTYETYLESLNNIIDALLREGVTNADGLKDKLTEIALKIENGKIKPAINQLEAFEQQVASMLQDGYISSETAGELTKAAKQLVELLELEEVK